MWKSALVLLLLLPVTAGDEPVDLVTVSGIREQAFENSEVNELITYLTDHIGPRLTGSPGMMRANEWTRDKLAEWGLENARVEPWGEFGRGWGYTKCSIHMVTPHEMTLVGLPAAWTGGTNGIVRGEVIRAEIRSEKDMEAWKGKLAGKILLVDEAREIPQAFDSLATRHDHDSLDDLCNVEVRDRGNRGDGWRARARKRYEMADKLRQFLVDEGVVATVGTSSFYGGVVRLTSGGSRDPEDIYGVPKIVLTAENYTYLSRLVADDVSVSLELDIEVEWYEDDLQAYNTLAEIPGTDKADEIVMLGAHLDSWHAGTGATDNGAGVVVMMEAVRILKALGVQPRRTIRIALWSGEEQGLLGSRYYVSEHFAGYPESEDQSDLPRWLREDQGELEFKPGYEKVSAYYNLDNGSGRIRGIYTQGNLAAGEIFAQWLAPFADVDATSVTQRDTGGTDHLSFDRVGIPGFQFIQDRLQYMTRTHHSNLDVRDNIVVEDLMQASAIVANFVWHTAMREERIPRKPMQKPEKKEEVKEKKPAAASSSAQ